MRAFEAHLQALYRGSTGEPPPRYWRVAREELVARDVVDGNGAPRLDELLDRANALALGEGLAAVLFLDLGCTRRMGRWSSARQARIASGRFDANVYAVAPGPELFDIAGETYFVDIEMQPLSRHRALFRSFRNPRDQMDDFEFSNGVYLRPVG